LSLGETHSQQVREEDPAEVFLTTLRSMLDQGAVTLAERNSMEQLELIVGWKDGKFAYLIPEAARVAVTRHLRDGGGHFPYSPRAINEALDSRGALIKSNDGKAARMVKIGRKSRRVLQIPIQFIEPIIQPNDND